MNTDLKHKLTSTLAKQTEDPVVSSSEPPRRSSAVRVLGWCLHLAWGGVLRVLTAIFSVAILASAVIAWNMRDGQLELDMMTPYVVEMFNPESSDYAVTVENTALRWGGWRNRFDLTVSGLAVQNAAGFTIARFGDAALEFSIEALLSGYVAPTRVILIGPELSVSRQPDGAFSLGVQGTSPIVAAGESPEAGADVEDLLQDLFSPLPEANDLSTVGEEDLITSRFFQGISVRDARMTYADRARYLVVTSDNVGIEVTRTDTGITAAFTLTSNFGAADVAMEGQLIHGFDGNQQVFLDFENIWLPDLARFYAELEPLRGFDLTTDGSVSVTRLANGDIPEITFDVTTGEGGFQIPNVLDLPIAVAAAQVSGVVDQNLGRVQFDQALLETAGPILRYTGALVRRPLEDGEGFDSGAPNIQGTLEIADLDIAELGRYWPQPVAKKARPWVLEHFLSGRVPQARIDMDFDGSTFGIPGTKPGPFEVALEFQNAVVSYFGELDPVQEAAGLVRITPELLSVKAPEGKLGDLVVRDVDVNMEDILNPGPLTTVSFVASGDIPEVFRIIDQDPLNLVQKLDLDTSEVSGEGASRIVLSFPAKDGVQLEELKVAATSNLQNVNWPDFRPDMDLTEGDFQLKIDRGALTLEGEARINTLPVELDVFTDLSGQQDVEERFQIAAVLNVEDVAAIQPVVSEVLDGVVDFNADIRKMRAGPVIADVNLDLTHARLEIPGVPQVKAAGVPGRASIDLTLPVETRDVDVRAFELEAEGLYANGSAQLNMDTGLERVQVERLAWGRTDISAVIGQEVDRYIVAVSGQVLDLKPYLDEITNAETVEPEGPEIAVRATVQQVFVGETTYFDAVRATARVSAGRVQQGSLEATAGVNNTPVTLTIQPSEMGRSLELKTDDAAAVITTMFPQDRFVGGSVIMTAQIDDQDPKHPVMGELVVTNFEVERAPVLARILQLGSFTGIGELLQGEGLSFTELRAPFRLEDNILILTEAKAYGPSVGLTLEGTFDRTEKDIAMSGTFIPVYGLSNFISNIPLLGTLLTGNDGEVVGIAYGISGTSDQPQVTVNPLSALTPGFLRRLFPFIGDIGTTPETATPDETSEPSASLEREPTN